MRPFRRTAGLVAGVALAGTLSACGGFGSDPSPPVDQDITSYVALGDTFTAAPDTGSSSDDGCRRSDANYPALLADELGIHDVKDVSCAGATTAALTGPDRTGKGRPKVPAQLDAIDHDTGLVTIGIGLADRDLLAHAFQVCTALPCTNKPTPQAVLNDARAAADSLTSAIRAIQNRAPDAYIVVVGYPTITPDSGSCDALPKLDQTGLDAANILLDEINHQLVTAARQTGAAYADIAERSVGHELCSDEPWVRGGPDGDSVEYHPDAAEQKAAAAAIAELVKSR